MLIGILVLFNLSSREPVVADRSRVFVVLVITKVCVAQLSYVFYEDEILDDDICTHE